MPISHDNWKTAWARGSKFEDIIWIGNDVLAWCSGLHIVFYQIEHKKKSILWCWSHDIGEGVRSLSSHTKYPIFAFAEKASQPKIMVYTYPSLIKISECANGFTNHCLATGFTSTDYIISMGSYPHFRLSVWNWRTGEKIAAVHTHIRDEIGQIMRINLIGPVLVAQVGKSCGEAYVWDLIITKEATILKEYEIKLPRDEPIRGLDWSSTSTEPLLALVDKEGHIYLSNYDGSDVYRIMVGHRCNICIEKDLPIIKWFQDGLVLRTPYCQISFYKKFARLNVWRKLWYVKTEKKPYILITNPYRDRRFFYYTYEGELMQVDIFEENDKPVVSKCFDNGGVYRFVDFVYPWCHHLFAICDANKEYVILECYEGTLISNIIPDVDDEILCQTSHPEFPLIVLATNRGELHCVSIVKPTNPKIIARLRIQRTPLDFVKFSLSGRSLIAAETKAGNCYYINMQRVNMYDVQTLIRVGHPISDVLIFEGYKKLRILVLYTIVRNVGHSLFLYEIVENQTLVVAPIVELLLPGVYRNLYHVPGNPMFLIGTPYMTRQLRVQKIQDFKNITFEDGLMTGHLMKLASLFVDRWWIITMAIDGIVHVRDKTVRREVACIKTHHREELGTKKAMSNKQGDLIIALGYNGSLIATKFSPAKKELQGLRSPKEKRTSKVEHKLYEKMIKKIDVDYASLDPLIYDILTSPLYEFPDSEKEGDKTWTEWRYEMQLKEEEEESREQKTAILNDFEELRNKVKKLLDENEASTEIEKLPIAAFDLDIKGRDHKLKVGRDICENLRLEFEHNINETKRVSKWIRKNFWDPQKVVAKSLYAIFDEMEVVNYPSIAEDPDDVLFLKYINFHKKTAYSVLENDRFEPWKIYTEQELQMEASKKHNIYREQDKRIHLLMNDWELEDKEEDLKRFKYEMEERKAVNGTTTHRFIESSPYYPQFGYYGFAQTKINNRFFLHDCTKLRDFFNNKFNEIYALKEREMNVIRDRIERIRYIDSELNIMFNKHVPHVPTDPVWHWQERPESIITVRRDEIKAKPYISPSAMEILMKQAAEEERIRKLLLADDFRERALMAMMNGVLEVRWEDIIKIDVPKPACMLAKKPEDYTSEDILAVKQYEKDVQFLKEERERYHRMLDAEYLKVMEQLKEGIDKFNGKLNNLFHMKMDIEAAINQLYLRYVRGLLLVHHRIMTFEEENSLKKRIADKEDYEREMDEHIKMFQNVHQKVTDKYTSLVSKEKAFAKKFKSEFYHMHKVQMEILERQCNRRPRVNLRNLESSDFYELAEDVLGGKGARIYLPSECKDYLRILHNFDIRPVTVPPSIDASNWENLIRLRRAKINLELMIRGAQSELMDVEAVLLGFEQKMEKCKIDMEDMKKDIVEKRMRQMMEDLDVEIQLVLKMGQVEIDLEGELTDSKHAVLVSKTTIDSANSYIRAAGECKLKALNNLLSFQRGTLLKQWQHMCRKKNLEDLKEDLRFTESTTVTKEMQGYLKRKAKGLPDDKTPQQLDDDIEAVKRKFQKALDEERSRLEAVEKEIANLKVKNEQLDRQILEMNMARCDMELRRDIVGEERQKEHLERKVKMVMHRSALVKKLQENYAELVELQTEHELLRLKRYPTFHFRMLDENEETRKNVRTNLC